MAKYRGTCIGGVADGHWIERDDVEIRIEKKRKIKPIDDLDKTFGDEVLDYTVYKFVLLLGTSNAEIGVWAPHAATLEEVVERLVRFYNPRAGLVGTPNANPHPIRNQ